MTVHDVRAMTHRPQGPPDAVWLSERDARALLQEAVGPRCDLARLASGFAFKLFDVPIHVFDLIA